VKVSDAKILVENSEAGHQLREWRDFPELVARWTLNRV